MLERESEIKWEKERGKGKERGERKEEWRVEGKEMGERKGTEER